MNSGSIAIASIEVYNNSTRLLFRSEKMTPKRLDSLLAFRRQLSGKYRICNWTVYVRLLIWSKYGNKWLPIASSNKYKDKEYKEYSNSYHLKGCDQIKTRSEMYIYT